jgi:hypothetical protein
MIFWQIGWGLPDSRRSRPELEVAYSAAIDESPIRPELVSVFSTGSLVSLTNRRLGRDILDEFPLRRLELVSVHPTCSLGRFPEAGVFLLTNQRVRKAAVTSANPRRARDRKRGICIGWVGGWLLDGP